MIPFPLNENRFSFFVADHQLVGQFYTNPKSDRSLLSCLKVIQCSTSEIGDAPLYNSCSLPIQVTTSGPLPAPSKCKSGLFNASDDPLEVVERKPEAEDTARKTWTKEFIEKDPGNHWWNSPAAYSADCQIFRRLTHNCECMCEGGLEV